MSKLNYTKKIVILCLLIYIFQKKSNSFTYLFISTFSILFLFFTVKEKKNFKFFDP